MLDGERRMKMFGFRVSSFPKLCWECFISSVILYTLGRWEVDFEVDFKGIFCLQLIALLNFKTCTILTPLFSCALCKPESSHNKAFSGSREILQKCGSAGF